MSFRGRGRGGGGRFGGGGGRFGGGGGGFHPGKQVTWDVFPEIENLGTAANVSIKLHLAKCDAKLQSYWKSSPYYYEGNNVASRTLSADIERYSDKISDKSKPKPPLSHFINMAPEYVPAELARGVKKHGTRQVRWDPEKDMKKFDIFEKLENKRGPDTDEKKEDEGSENEDENIEEDEEEDYSDNDYEQNIEFDDDDDGMADIADDNDNDEGEY